MFTLTITHETGVVMYGNVIDVIINNHPDHTGSWGIVTQKKTTIPNNGGKWYERIYVKPVKIEIQATSNRAIEDTLGSIKNTVSMLANLEANLDAILKQLK